MKEVTHLVKRFKFSLEEKKGIYINNSDVQALQTIINVLNEKHNSQFEDALLLFYVLGYWRIENGLNLVERDEKMHVYKLTDAPVILERLAMSLKTKDDLIDEIFTELRVYQLNNKVHKENWIKKLDVRSFFDDILDKLKNKQQPINLLLK